MSSKINYNYLRSTKAEKVKEMHNNRFETKNDLSTEVYDNATIIPLKNMNDSDAFWGRGGVLDSSGEYVELSKIPRLIDGSYQVDNSDYIDEKVVYCGYFRHHWGEFIAYCLPRLWYVLKNDITIDKYIFFTNENTDYSLSGNYKNLIERLGIIEKVQIISKPTKYKSVIVPELSYDTSSKYYSKDYLGLFELINKNSHSNLTEKYEKIYLTRSSLKKASSMESGNDMLDDFFSKNGFTILSPEKISLDDLIYYLDNASTIACISGTLPHNVLFSTNQGKDKNVIIIERNAMFNFFQPETDIMTNAKVTFIDANISLYPVELSYGPFIYAANKYLKKFAEDNNYIIPNEKFQTEKYKKQLFKEYIGRYKNEYGLCLYMPLWNLRCSNAIFEAYQDGEAYFEDYLKGKKYYKASQYFSIDFFKRIVKRIIRR